MRGQNDPVVAATGEQIELSNPDMAENVDTSAAAQQNPTAWTAGVGLSSRWYAVLVGILAFALSAIGSNRTWFSGDELVTISAANRSLPELWKMLGTVDMHQGLYYLFMHVWTGIFPATEFATRLSSAIAVGVAAAGVVVLGEQVSTRSVAVTAGIVFAILPRVTFAGADIRPYAFTMLIAVWLTIFCITAARRSEAWRWVLYSLLLIFAIVLNLHLALIIPAHAVAVQQFGKTPRVFRDWALAAGGAVAVMAPFVFLAKAKFAGLWVPGLSSYTFRQVLQQQYLGGAEHPVNNTPVSIVVALILLAGLVIAFRSGLRRPSGLLAVVLTWIIVPTVILVVLSLFKPIYVPRYLSFTAPAFALLLGMCIVKIGRSRAGIAAVLLVLALAAAPVYIAQRENPRIRNSQDYGPVADTLDRYASDGDCLLIEDAGFDFYNEKQKRWPPLRSMLVVRPDVYSKLIDSGVVNTTHMFNRNKPVIEWAQELSRCPALWTISDRDMDLANHERGPNLVPGLRLGKTDSYKIPAELGFRIVERWQFRTVQVAKSVRVPRP